MKTEWFEEQIYWLAQEGYATLSLQDLVEYMDGVKLFPQKSIVISFDLGTARYDEYANVVIPLLRKYNFQAVFFLLNNEGVIGDDCTHPDNKFCWDDLRGWMNEGLISIGSHGIYHPDYATETDENIRWDMRTSKNILEEKLAITVLAIAYPFDSSPENAQRIARSVGYEMGISGNIRTDLGVKVNDGNRYNLPRMYPYAGDAAYPLLNAYNQTFAEVITKTVMTPGVTLSQVIPASTAAFTATVAPAVTTLPGSTPEAAKVLGSDESYVKGCNIANALTGAERTLALSQVFFTPNYAEAVINASCNHWGQNNPEAIVLHFTRGELSAALAEFQTRDRTSAHYVIDRDGTVYQTMPESYGARHVTCIAGCLECCPTYLCGDNHPELHSIGIELVNQGQVRDDWQGPIYEDYNMAFGNRYWDDYPSAQLQALTALLLDITARYGIPLDADHIIAHSRIQQKADPGPALNLFEARTGNPPQEAILKDYLP